uniref:C2 domain-containing protein n=1 Tax=Branchiostoma floridae TaxID=7739 RepID=C3YXF9_BRAFL|eukprot:XP_002598756.1 hypothetical protein BRAFLDRAFT_120751 [Branchiostoma floridae]
MVATLKQVVDDCKLPGKFLSVGAKVFLTHTEDMPVSAELYWSAFRNFVDLQLYMEGHENLRVLKGYGEVGTVVSFYYDPTDLAEGQRKMKLVEKDNSTRTWKVQEAEPNELYKSYEMTIKVEGTDAAKVTISVRFVSAIKDHKERRQDIAYHKVHLLGARIRDVLNFVVREKLGGKHLFSLEIPCSREKMWGIVGNFNDVTWIRESSHTVVDGIFRTIYFTKDRSLKVRLAWADSSDYLFVYEGDNSPDFLHCKYYRGRIQFFAVNPNRVRVTYDCSFIPANDSPMQEFKTWFVGAFSSRIAWLEETFSEPKPGEGEPDSATYTGPPAFKKGAYSTGAHGIVRVPLEDVWKVFRPFGRECMEYWKIYDSMEIEAPGEDKVGCIRVFKTSKTKRTIREKLEWRDDDNHVEIYSLLSMDPTPPVTMSNTYTTITMTALGEKETEVKFECTFDVSSSLAVSRIQDNQKGAYMACISGLQQLFHSEVGTLEVVVESAADLARTDGWFDADPYVVLAVNDGKPVTTKVCGFTQKPIWDERFQLPVTSRTRNIIFTVMDRDTIGQDDIMGTANVNLDELTSDKEKKMTLDVQGGGTLNVRLYLKMHDKLKELEEGEKLITSLAIPFLAPVAQSELDVIRNEFTSLITSFLGPGQKYELSYMKRLRTHPDVPLEEIPAACVPMPTQEMFTPYKAGRLMQRLMEFIASQGQIMVRLAQVKGIWDPWKANFSGYLPANEKLIEEWQKDEEFCRQYLQGINPMLVTLCKDQSRIPAGMLGLKGQGKTTLQLMEENRLFIVDYEPMLDVPATPGKFFYAPIVLMYREELEGGKSRLNMLGIQLTRDKALQEFCKMTEGPGQLHGFPREISTKQLLIDCLTNIIFNVSAQHSAINFPQYDYYSFIPNRPAQLSSPMPVGPNDMLESAVLEALPPPHTTTLQVLLSYMLSMPSQTAITGVEAMKDVYPEVHEKFHAELQNLSKEIKGRNEDLKAEGKVAYTYLDPENVAMSIDV